MTGGFPLWEWLFTAFSLFIYSIHSFIPLIVCYRAFHNHDTFVLHCFFAICDAIAAYYYLFNLGLVSFPPAGVVGGRYLYTSDLLKLGTFCQVDVTTAGQGLRQSPLASLLCHHPDRCFMSWLLRDLDEWFPIGFDPARCNLCLHHSVIRRWLPST